MSIHADQTVLPPAPVGDSQLRELSALLTSGTELSLVSGSGQVFKLTTELRDVLAHATSALSVGQAVTLEPRRTLLSTQEAADLLGVSRPTVVKLLEAGEIAFTKPGRHRRVQLEDVLEYQRRVRARRHGELAAMSADAANDDAYHAVDRFTETR